MEQGYQDYTPVMESTRMPSSSLAIGALIVGIIAIIGAVVAIVLAFVIQGPQGEPGPQGPQGNEGKAGVAIDFSSIAVKIGTILYTLPTVYNYSNIVIPVVEPGSDVYFSVSKNQTKIGDIFLVDNTNNPGSTFYLQYSGYDNNISSIGIDEFGVNSDQTGKSNSIYVQITAGKKDQNIIMFANNS